MSNENHQLTERQKATQSAFLAVHIITGQCHAILNTQFVQPKKKPEWYDKLKKKLDKTKALANEWIDKIAPEVSASIPAQIIGFGTTFSASIEEIHDLCNKHPEAKGADNQYVKQAAGILNYLASAVAIRQNTVADMQKKLAKWGSDMQAAHDDLKAGAINIQSAIKDAQTDIKKMDAAIANYEKLIEGYNKAISYSAMAVGVGVFLTVVGVAIAVGTAGTGVWIGGAIAGVGVGMAVGGVVAWKVYHDKIQATYSEIGKLQKQKDVDYLQIVALKGLASASNQVIKAVELSTTTLSDFRTTWKLLENELKSVNSKLQNGEKMESIFMQKVLSKAAKKEWDAAVELAKSLAKAKVTIQHQKVEPLKAAA